MMTRDQVSELLRSIEDGPSTARERQLALLVRQLQSQHDFAFASWQQAIKRSGRLSADLEVSRARSRELDEVIASLTVVRPSEPKVDRRSIGVHDARTVINKGASIPPKFDVESARTRIHKHSGGALVIGAPLARGTRPGSKA